MGLKRFGTSIGKAVANDPQNKGDFGEMIIASLFSPKIFGSEEVFIINNIYFDTGVSTHQIDHVVIYKTGIFCIETKNIQGRIMGDDTSEQWLILNNKRKYFMLNPIIQNVTHVKVLNAFFESRYSIHPVLVFIKGNKPKSKHDYVLNINEIIDYVKNYKCDAGELTNEEMKNIYTSLMDYKNSLNITRAEHIYDVKNHK